MIITDDFVDRLKEDEGYRSEVYKDSVDVMTIGFGTNLEAVGNPGMYKDMIIDAGINEDQAEWLLREEIAHKLSLLEDEVPEILSGLSDVRRQTLLNMAYNMGVGSLLTFDNMLTALREERYEVAANEMLKSQWHEQVGRRAKRLAKQMRTNKIVRYEDLEDLNNE